MGSGTDAIGDGRMMPMDHDDAAGLLDWGGLSSEQEDELDELVSAHNAGLRLRGSVDSDDGMVKELEPPKQEDGAVRLMVDTYKQIAVGVDPATIGVDYNVPLYWGQDHLSSRMSARRYAVPIAGKDGVVMECVFRSTNCNGPVGNKSLPKILGGDGEVAGWVEPDQMTIVQVTETGWRKPLVEMKRTKDGKLMSLEFSDDSDGLAERHVVILDRKRNGLTDSEPRREGPKVVRRVGFVSAAERLNTILVGLNAGEVGGGVEVGGGGLDGGVVGEVDEQTGLDRLDTQLADMDNEGRVEQPPGVPEGGGVQVTAGKSEGGKTDWRNQPVMIFKPEDLAGIQGGGETEAGLAAQVLKGIGIPHNGYGAESVAVEDKNPMHEEDKYSLFGELKEGETLVDRIRRIKETKDRLWGGEKDEKRLRQWFASQLESSERSQLVREMLMEAKDWDDLELGALLLNEEQEVELAEGEKMAKVDYVVGKIRKMRRWAESGASLGDGAMLHTDWLGQVPRGEAVNYRLALAKRLFLTLNGRMTEDLMRGYKDVVTVNSQGTVNRSGVEFVNQLAGELKKSGYDGVKLAGWLGA